MHRRNVVVGIFVLICLNCVAVDSRNLTTTLAIDNSAKNITLVGVKPKLAKHKSHLTDDDDNDDDDEPSTDVAAEIAEGSRVHNKWETGNQF